MFPNGLEEIDNLLTYKRVNIHNDNSDKQEEFTKTSKEENIKTSQKDYKNSSITESSLKFIDEFNQIFISVLNLQNNALLDNISYGKTPTWDSLLSFKSHQSWSLNKIKFIDQIIMLNL